MIECYFKWCEYHPVTEPFCTNKECTASPTQIKEFSKLRKKELDDYARKRRLAHEQE